MWLNNYITLLLTLRSIALAEEAQNIVAQDHPTVLTTSGRVSGYTDRSTTPITLNKWLGIRFAQDTAGQNRWKPPRRIRPAPSDIFNATAYGPACLQGRYVG